MLISSNNIFIGDINNTNLDSDHSIDSHKANNTWCEVLLNIYIHEFNNCFLYLYKLASAFTRRKNLLLTTSINCS